LHPPTNKNKKEKKTQTKCCDSTLSLHLNWGKANKKWAKNKLTKEKGLNTSTNEKETLPWP